MFDSITDRLEEHMATHGAKGRDAFAADELCALGLSPRLSSYGLK